MLMCVRSSGSGIPRYNLHLEQQAGAPALCLAPFLNNILRRALTFFFQLVLH